MTGETAIAAKTLLICIPVAESCCFQAELCACSCDTADTLCKVITLSARPQAPYTELGTHHASSTWCQWQLKVTEHTYLNLDANNHTQLCNSHMKTSQLATDHYMMRDMMEQSPERSLKPQAKINIVPW